VPINSLDYISPRAVTYRTTPGVSPSGPSTHMAERAATIAELAVGQLVSIKSDSPVTREKVGVITQTGPENFFENGDCMVLLDGWDRSLAFYWTEIVHILRRPRVASR
jgi:hypothetical protein